MAEMMRFEYSNSLSQQMLFDINKNILECTIVKKNIRHDVILRIYQWDKYKHDGADKKLKGLLLSQAAVAWPEKSLLGAIYG